MAYKDEYEVARLYADPAFVEKLKGSFEGDWKIKFHLAPPAFSKKDAKGHLVKKQYGPWVLPAMRVLAKLKSCAERRSMCSARRRSGGWSGR